MPTESVSSDRTGGGFDSITSRSEHPPLSSYIDSLVHPSGIFSQSQPGLLGGLIYRNRAFTDDLIQAFSERCRYSDLGETTASRFEGVQIHQSGSLSTYTFISQALIDYRCVVITSELTAVEASPHSASHLSNFPRLPTPPKPLIANNGGALRRRHRGPPEFAQPRKSTTPRIRPRVFLSTEEIETNPYWKTESEREAQAAHYKAMTDFDWEKHPLGSMQRWSPLLKSTVEWILASPQPALLIWGPNWTAIL